MAAGPGGSTTLVSVAPLRTDYREGLGSRLNDVEEATFIVSRTGSTADALTLDYAVAGSGTNPADALDFYRGTLPTGQVTIPAGSASTTLIVYTQRDVIFEYDEGYTLTLANPPAGTSLGQASSSGIIRNDDSAPGLIVRGQGASRLAEGAPGEITTFTFTIGRVIQDSQPEQSVSYAVIGNGDRPASAADFVGGVFPSGTVTLGRGEFASQTVAIQVIGDGIFEPDESFTLTLTDTNFGGFLERIATATISDDITGSLSKFGSVVTSSNTLAGGVFGLYKALLARVPDPLGLESFTTAIENGASLTDVAGAILASPERAGQPVDAITYVQSLYAGALGRPADPSGLAYYTDQLGKGVSQASVAVQIATSSEAQTVLAPTFAAGVFVPDASEASVARLFYGLLGRAPDAGGLSAFSAYVETGGGGAAGEAARLGQAATSLLASPEYQAKHGGESDAAFVSSLYANALGRAADAGGAAYYVGELASGVSRSMVALQVAESPEAQVHLVGVIEQGRVLAA